MLPVLPVQIPRAFLASLCEHLTFSGIAFHHTQWLTPPAGFDPVQAAEPVTVHALPDLSAIRLAEASADALEAADADAPPDALPLTVPLGVHAADALAAALADAPPETVLDTVPLPLRLPLCVPVALTVGEVEPRGNGRSLQDAGDRGRPRTQRQHFAHEAPDHRHQRGDPDHAQHDVVERGHAAARCGDMPVSSGA